MNNQMFNITEDFERYELRVLFINTFRMLKWQNFKMFLNSLFTPCKKVLVCNLKTKVDIKCF